MDKLTEKINLSNDFPETTYEQWREQVEKDLKGVPFEKKLISKTYEGIDLQPIYNKEDIKNLPFIDSKPGSPNFVRGTSTSGYLKKLWNIQQYIPYSNPDDFNKALLSDLSRGQNCIYIKPDIENNFEGVKFDNIDDLNKIFNDIDINTIPVFIDCGVCGFTKAALLFAYMKEKNQTNIEGALNIDPIGYAVSKGTMYMNSNTAMEYLAKVTKWAIVNFPGLRTIGINTIHYNNAGANAVQELAFAMATGVEYMNQLIDKGLKPEDIASKMRFSFGVGSFYFMEVSKFRAARILWSQICKAYGVEGENSKMLINAETSYYNQTKLDPYVNLLRVTTEAFSALIGGVDSLRTSPFDETIRQSDEFSRRIARNTQIVLNEETHISGLIDPAGGSYFVEHLTSELAQSSYKLFKEIQAQGGMLESLKKGFPQSEVGKIASAREKDFAKRKSILVGTNAYANVKEERLDEKPVDTEMLKKNRDEVISEIKSKRKEDKVKDKIFKLLKDKSFETAIEAMSAGAFREELELALDSGKDEVYEINPLKIKRGAEIFEELRNRTLEYKAKTNNDASIFLATMGTVKQHKARADFSRGFLETAGFNVIYSKGFDSPAEAISEAEKHGAKAIVICSTDETYPELVPAFLNSAKGKDLFVILAGYPKEHIETFRSLGLNEFIYLGADVYLVNKKIQDAIFKN